jgi:YVTN family beta-propeller protein
MRRPRVAAGVVMAFLLLVSLIGCIQPRPLGYDGRDGFPDYKTEVFIVNGLAETISVIDCETLTIHHDVMETGLWPNQIAFHEGEGYLVNSGDNSITVFREDDLKVTGEIDLGKNSNPWMILFLSGGGGLVSNFVASDVAFINIAKKKVDKRVDVGTAPEGMAVVGNKAYVGNTAWNQATYDFDQGTVSVIDIANRNVIKTINTHKNPQAVIPFPGRNEVHVICTGTNGGPGSDDGKIDIIDTTSDEVKATLNIGGSPGWSGQGIDEAEHWVYLTGVGGVQVYNYQTRTVVHGSDNYLIVGKDPENDFYSGLAIDPVYDQIFVCNFTYDKIIVLKKGSGKIKKEIQGSDGAQLPIYLHENL